MNWLLSLYDTYEANLKQVGVIGRKYNDQEYTLLPVSHTTQNAHIEVQITEDGEFHSAEVLTNKKEMNTLIPCTEDSASRAGSKIAPYPLHDKLSYVAGDYIAYGGEVKQEEPFAYYIKQLQAWAESTHAVPKVRSIYRYLSKGRLIEDLIAEKVLYTDANGKLLEKWDKQAEQFHDKQNKPDIFSAIAGDQYSAFVRFNVYSPVDTLTDIWKDQAMYTSFIRFYSEQLGQEDWCYAKGAELPATDKHANKIRHAGDKAKLISANDTSGFTFRGRFSSSREAASISYDVSQKAHNALKWLINRQGKIIDQRVFLAWGDGGVNVPEPLDDTLGMAPEVAVVPQNEVAFTEERYAGELAKALDGYRNSLGPKSDVNLLVLDSATTGRMAVLYYRSMNLEFYLEKVLHWHSTCVWLHRYRKDEAGQFVYFYGTPAIRDIAFAAYGPDANERTIKGMMERMLPCIVDGLPIPRDIVTSAYHRASNPVAMERWEWEKTLSITCALINKRYEQEGLRVAVDESIDDRSYLFGRLLAVADVLERRALGSEETRASNAIRYMHAFANHPSRTWRVIYHSLLPYQVRLGTKSTYWNKIIDEITSQIPADQFNDKPLSQLYLLGFSSQRHELYQKKENNETHPTESTSN